MRKPNFMMRYLCAFHHLHLNEAPCVFGAEQELESVHEFDFASQRDILFICYVLQGGECLVDEPPLAVVEDEVANGFLLIGREFFVGRYMAVDVPWVEVLVCVNHQPMVFRAERIALFAAVIEVEHREKTFVFRSTERAGGFGAVIEHIPLLCAVWI